MQRKALSIVAMGMLIAMLLSGCGDKDDKDNGTVVPGGMTPEQEQHYKEPNPTWNPAAPPLPTNPDGTRG